MSSPGILKYFTKVTPEEAEEQQKQRWETLRDECRRHTMNSRVRDEKGSITRVERMRERSRHRSKAYRDRCRARLEDAGEDNMRKEQRNPKALLKHISTLPVRTVVVEDIPLSKASRKQLELGTAPKRKRAPPQYWQRPELWPDIAAAAIRMSWKPEAIVLHLRSTPEGRIKYDRLNRGTVWKMFGKDKKSWSEKTMQAVLSEKNRRTITKSLGRPQMLSSSPDIINALDTQLRTLRGAGVPLSVPVIRGLMLGFIRAKAPHLLEDGKFKISKMYIRNYMKHYTGWSYRVGTRSAGSIPQNWDELGRNMAIRISNSIRTYGTPPELVINGDQTPCHLIPTPNRTWAPMGDRQVTIAGADDKRAVTLMVAITASGDLLRTQVIVAGKTGRSLPAPPLRTAVDKKVWYDFSGGDKHWSNVSMMKSWINNEVVPYIQRVKLEKKLPDSVRAILIIDCWSVHRSAEFLAWMKANYSKLIRIHFVPANCTKLFQPDDVGINRYWKWKMANGSVEWMAHQVQDALKAQKKDVSFPTDMPTLRDASLSWIVAAHEHVASQPELVRNAWKNCKGSGYDLSYATLTSSHMLDMVREAFQDDDWMFKNATENGMGMGAEELVWDDVHDDTALTSEEMIEMIASEGVPVDEDGGFIARSALDEELTDEDAGGDQELSDEVSEDSDEGVHDPMVIDLENEAYN